MYRWRKTAYTLLYISIAFLLAWCNSWDKSTKEITETIWNRTCTWKWVDKIEWYTTCFSTIWSSYEWDVRWHKLHWKWKVVKKDWTIFEWYFNEWYFIAWKITYKNGDAIRWLWSPLLNKDWESKLELWKRFTKIDWSIELGEFDNNDNLKYWMKEYNDTFYVWDFKFFITSNIEDLNNAFNTKYIYNWYVVNNNWCSKVSNRKPTDITRTVTKTITNTVYRNIWFKSALSQQWTILNPYVVNLRIKDY